MRKSWLTGAGAGVALFVLLLLSSMSWTGAIFVSVLVGVIVGIAMWWTTCKPSEAAAEPPASARGPASSDTEPLAAAAAMGSPAAAATMAAPRPATADMTADAEPSPPPAKATPPAAVADPAPSLDPAPEPLRKVEPASDPEPVKKPAAAEPKAAKADPGPEAKPATPAPKAAAADPEPEPRPKPAKVEGKMPAKAAPAVTQGAEGTRPVALGAARDGGPDDLKQIKGVGPKLEAVLHGHGIYHFDQIAGWGPAEVAWMDGNLEGFRGRVSRDDWVRQAGTLASGGETAFSKKVGKGGVY